MHEQRALPGAVAKVLEKGLNLFTLDAPALPSGRLGWHVIYYKA